MPRLIPAGAGLVLSLAAPAAEKERLRALRRAVREEIAALAAAGRPPTLEEVRGRLQDGSWSGWRGVLRTWVDGW